jgi:two-component sensor histidine kinase
MSGATHPGAGGLTEGVVAPSRLRLYVAKLSANSVLAEGNLASAMSNLPDQGRGLGLEVIDVLAHPKRALTDGVIVTPTLIGLKANGQLTILGNLVDPAQLHLLLQSLLDDQRVRAMEALIVEKDELLASNATMAEELTHRVRNNLQLLHVMLSKLQGVLLGIDDKASVEAIIRRVVTLAEVYDQLLGTGMGRTVDFGQYLTSLCDSLPSIQPELDTRIRLNCSTISLMADLDVVTVMGMVVAETVSNSYKYAFPKEPGEINVSLQRSKNSGRAIIIVSDSGTGFYEQAGSKRHGLYVIRRLTQQVGGTAQLDSERGTMWTFCFPLVATAKEWNS